ncbi:MAG: hypothetical protein ACOVQT_09390 [Rubrivivax sp.]
MARSTSVAASAEATEVDARTTDIVQPSAGSSTVPGAHWPGAVDHPDGLPSMLEAPSVTGPVPWWTTRSDTGTPGSAATCAGRVSSRCPRPCTESGNSQGTLRPAARTSTTPENGPSRGAVACTATAQGCPAGQAWPTAQSGSPPGGAAALARRNAVPTTSMPAICSGSGPEWRSTTQAGSEVWPGARGPKSMAARLARRGGAASSMRADQATRAGLLTPS